MQPKRQTVAAEPAPVDKTLDLDLLAITDESRKLAASIKPSSGPWDVIVVGSGASGGMAAFQLATAGIKVLMLEAGRMLDHKAEYRTMEWPYASPRRGRLPGDHRALQAAEYNFYDRPYGDNPAFAKYKKLASYTSNTFTRNWVVNEKEHPTTGTPYSWVRARVLGGKTNYWGRVAIRYGPLQFKAASRDGFDVDWPIGYEDVSPYYDKVDLLLGCSGTKEGLIQVPDGIYQRPMKMNCVETHFKRSIAKMGRSYIPGRCGVSTEGQLNNKYRSRCLGRGRCSRGCDVNANFHSPAALVYPARDTGNLTIRPYSVVSEVFLDEATGKAAGVRVIDANTKEVMDFKARVVVLGAGTLDSTRILLNSKSPQHPNGLGNSSGLMGCYLSEHHMAASSRCGWGPSPRWTTDGRPRPTSRASATSPTSTPTSSAGITSRVAAAPTSTRGWPTTCPASARPSSRTYGSTTLRFSPSAASAKCFPARRTASPSTRRSRTPGASPSSASTSGSATTRSGWRRTWPTPQRRCSAPRARRTSRSIRPCCRRVGPSTRSAPRAWARTRRRR